MAPVTSTHESWIRASPRAGGPSSAVSGWRSRNATNAYMKNTSTASATGVEIPRSTVLSVTWPPA